MLVVVDGAQAPGVCVCVCVCLCVCVCPRWPALSKRVCMRPCAGGLRVNVTELGCDAYATSAHKWMLAPKVSALHPIPTPHPPGV